MKRLLLMTFVLVVGATSVMAQYGRVGIFGNATGTNCAITDAAVALLPVYVVHIGATGATAVQYTATKPACTTASYLSDTNVFSVTLGNSQTGMAIGYGACLTGDIHVQTINLFGSGTTPACCIYPITCHPDGVSTGSCARVKIDVVDCAFVVQDAPGQSGVINSTGACTCEMIIPVQESSWGQIKALYSE